MYKPYATMSNIIEYKKDKNRSVGLDKKAPQGFLYLAQERQYCNQLQKSVHSFQNTKVKTLDSLTLSRF